MMCNAEKIARRKFAARQAADDAEVFGAFRRYDTHRSIEHAVEESRLSGFSLVVIVGSEPFLVEPTGECRALGWRPCGAVVLGRP